MQSKKIADQTWLIRLLKGEELVTEMNQFCQRENIRLGYFTGIGAMAEVELSDFLHDERRYAKQTFTGSLEIVALHGNITSLHGAIYLHIHMAVGNEQLQMRGGHLHKAIIDPTAEIILHAYEGTVERALDPESGLNQLSL